MELLVKMILLIVTSVVFSSMGIEGVSDILEVKCPPIEAVNENQNNVSPFASKLVPRIRSSNNEYCQCSLTEHGTAKTAILKCEFNFEKEVILKDSLFPFKNYSVTSAYVRMKNAKSATITGDFFSSWMDAPSSALDLWHCGKVVIESTPEPHAAQLFTKLKTFVGVGIIDCSIDSLPPFFLRDRNRGALRLKECKIGTLNTGIFHNIDEIRYLNFENTVVQKVSGPLSSSGVLTLSKKEIHSWDGIEILNSTFHYVAPFSFNVTHKDIIEKFAIKQSSFGRLEKGALRATGDIDVLMTNNSFSQLDSLAIQVSVNGEMTFSGNVIQNSAPDSLIGLNCRNNSLLNNNTFFVQKSSEGEENPPLPFMDRCGQPRVSYIVMEEGIGSEKSVARSMVIGVAILSLLVVAGVLGVWGWKNRSLLRCHYRRMDTPLWRDERTPDGEEDPSGHDGNATSVVHNPTFTNEKIRL